MLEGKERRSNMPRRCEGLAFPYPREEALRRCLQHKLLTPCTESLHTGTCDTLALAPTAPRPWPERRDPLCKQREPSSEGQVRVQDQSKRNVATPILS